MPKLKVFRTATGFHDAYVAAPSRAAALRAWGSAKDLFASGAAEEVTDPELAAEPLASPGIVVKRSRGTLAEQIAALPPDRPARPGKPAPAPAPAKAPAKPARPKPRPGRTALDKAEGALADAEREQRAALTAFAKREAVLQRERRDLERRHADEIRRLTDARDAAAQAHEDALRDWRA